jgi:hypothetical protein
LNREGAVFCSGCGARLNAENPSPPLAPAEPVKIPSATPPVVIPQSESSARSPSKGWLRITANLLSLAFAAGFVLLVCLALPVLNISGRLLDAKLYKDALKQEDFYRRFPDLFAEQMTTSQASLSKTTHIDFKGVTTADWRLLAQELIPPDWLQAQMESLIDQIFASAKSNAAPPALKISLADVTTRLSGDSGFRIYKEIIQSKRACDLFDLFEILDWIDKDSQAYLPICSIPQDLSDFAAEIAGYSNGDAMIRDLIKDLPSQIPKEIALSDFFTLHMDRVGSTMGIAKTIAWIFLLLAGMCLLLVFISPMGRSLKGWLLLWGAPLALSGLICLVIALIMPSLLGGLIIGGFKSSLSPALQNVIHNIAGYISKSSAVSLGLQASGLLAIGILMCIASALVWGVGRFLAPGRSSQK